MILKKQDRRPDRKVNPFIGALLFVISLVLLLLTGPLGFVYGVFHSLFKKGIPGLGEYLLKVAISIDQLGNVLMQHLLNGLWVKKAGYHFGNRDETISSALGRNRQLGTLTAMGKAIDRFLDFIDPDHTLNSIDYYVEPSLDIIDRLSWIYIRENQVLFLKIKGQDTLFLPGGHRDQKGSDSTQLAAYLKELLDIQLNTALMEKLGTYESRYEGDDPAVFLRQHCYSSPFEGNFRPATGIEPVIWINYSQRERLTLADQIIMAVLKEKGLLV